jgi:hypothetical protein
MGAVGYLIKSDFDPPQVVKILMGKKAPGTKLVGFRNGYGGKCEEGEAPLDCAVREVKEETGLDLEKEKLIYIGKIIEGDKHVYFYIYFFDSEIHLPDSEKDFVDNRWFTLYEKSSYISEMFSSDHILMDYLIGFVKDKKYTDPKFERPIFDFSEDAVLVEQVKNIY